MLTCVIAFKLGLFVGMKYSLVHMCKTVSVLYLRLTFAKQMPTSRKISIESCRSFPWNIVLLIGNCVVLAKPRRLYGCFILLYATFINHQRVEWSLVDGGNKRERWRDFMNVRP